MAKGFEFTSRLLEKIQAVVCFIHVDPLQQFSSGDWLGIWNSGDDTSRLHWDHPRYPWMSSGRGEASWLLIMNEKGPNAASPFIHLAMASQWINEHLIDWLMISVPMCVNSWARGCFAKRAIIGHHASLLWSMASWLWLACTNWWVWRVNICRLLRGRSFNVYLQLVHNSGSWGLLSSKHREHQQRPPEGCQRNEQMCASGKGCVSWPHSFVNRLSIKKSYIDSCN